MSSKVKPDGCAYPPRGMSRAEAARYIGVGTTKFDQLVSESNMPPARAIGGRRVWDRLELDAAFSDLPAAGQTNQLDELLQGAGLAS